MDGNTVVSLLDEGVIREASTGDIELGTEFLETVDGWLVDRDLSTAGELGTGIDEHVSSPVVRNILETHGTQEASLLAVFRALSDYLPSSDEASRLQLSVFLTQLMRGLPSGDGTPANFFPIDANLLPVALDAFDKAVVYVWREDCPPCDLMRDDLGTIGENREGVALFSVYGPEWKESLNDQFEVVGAPTTLFVTDGTVDSRLHGAHYPEVITEELEKTLSS
ncbi:MULTISPECIES: thioredoxin family protein [Haloferax]|uniref:Thioredoxin domain-containing protein n=2 Tax=Haloferax TaxID=2251 RepID=A0A6G1Z6F5_9EURY|nr:MULTISPECIES: thioredoxin family protein [Haloferax]KAB1185358.1 thioredoxin family protein [Haloferax sp. CBA1149]MRW81998.1 hypothetical protein [Haloferax marinisediminis]